MKAAPRKLSIGIGAGVFGLAATIATTFVVQERGEPPAIAVQGGDSPALTRSAPFPGSATVAELALRIPEPGEASQEEPRRALATLARLMSGSRELDPELLSEMIESALDPARSLRERVRAVHWLARFCNDEALEVLERLLHGEPNSAVRRALAGSLGECPHPDAERLLKSIVEDDRLVGGAIRGLATRGDSEALKALLLDPSREAWVRAEAATALGRLEEGSATAVLMAALATSEDEELAAGLLHGLAAHDSSETEAVFRSLLADPDVPQARKLDALEALAEGSGRAEDVLIEVARSGSDEELREAAVDSLAWLEGSPEIAKPLGELLASEPSADVRAAVYRALASRVGASMPPEEVAMLLPCMLAESVPLARREAYRVAAIVLHRDPHPGLAETFDETMVPWLQREAREGASPYARKTSISTLGLAGTQASEQALLDLIHSDDRDIADAAQHALARRERASDG